MTYVAKDVVVQFSLVTMAMNSMWFELTHKHTDTHTHTHTHTHSLSHTHTHVHTHTHTLSLTHTHQDDIDSDCLSRKLSSGKCLDSTESSTTDSMLVSLSKFLWAPRLSTSLCDENSDSTASDSEQGSSSDHSGSSDDELNTGINDLTVDSINSNANVLDSQSVCTHSYAEIVTTDIVEDCTVSGDSQGDVEGSGDSSRDCDEENEMDDCVFDDLCDFKVPDSGFVDGGEPEYAFGDQVVDMNSVPGFSCDGGFYVHDDVC